MFKIKYLSEKIEIFAYRGHWRTKSVEHISNLHAKIKSLEVCLKENGNLDIK